MFTVSMVEFPKWLEEELKKRGMSQADLSRLSGLSPAHISKIMSGSNPAGVEAAQGIAQALKLPPEIVYRAAGLLPKEMKTDPRVTVIAYLLERMSDTEKDEVVAFAEWKARAAERRDAVEDLRARLDAIPPEKTADILRAIADWATSIGATVTWKK